MKSCFAGPISQNLCAAFDLWRVFSASEAWQHPCSGGLCSSKPAARLTTDPTLTTYLYPVKQKRALLKSNPPRDNWMRRRNKNVSAFWGGQKPPQKDNGRPLFQSLLCLENLTVPKVQNHSNKQQTSPKSLSTFSGKVHIKWLEKLEPSEKGSAVVREGVRRGRWPFVIG